MNMPIHHIGILVRDIGVSAADYEARFGYRLLSDIVHDPQQTARVAFLGRPEDEMLLELITPDGPNSKLANALKNKGGGLHHFCFQVDDINLGLEQLRRKKMRVLCEPVEASAFDQRKIAWLMGLDGVPVELLESPPIIEK